MGDIKFSITVDSTGAVKAVKDFEGAIDGTGKASEAAQPKMAGLGVQVALAQVAVAAMTSVLRGAIGIGQAAVQNAIEQEQADQNLRAALELSGRTIEGNLGHYKNFASAKQLLTKYTDEEIQASQALLLQMTNLDQNGIDRAVKGSMGLASVMGTDLKSASMMVMKAMEGNYTALGRYGIKVDESLTAEQKQAAMLEQLETLYGRSEAEIKTYGGTIGQLTKAWNESLEEAGRAVTENESVRKALAKVQKLVQDLAPDLRAIAAGFAEVAAQIISVGVAVAKLPADIRKKLFGPVVDGAGDAAKAFNTLNQTLGGWSEWQHLAAARASALGVQLKDQKGQVVDLGKIWQDYGGNSREAFEAIIRGNYGPVIKEILKDVGGRAYEAAAGYVEAADGIDQVGKNAAPASEGVKELDRWLAKTAEQIRELAHAKNLAKRATEELLRPGKELIEQQKEFKKTLGELGALELDHSEDKLPKLADSVDDLEVAYLDAAAAVAQLAEYSNALTPPVIKSWQDWGADVQGIIQNTFSALNTLIGGMASISQQSLSNTLANLDAEYQARLKYIDQTITDETLRAEAIAALDAEFEKKKLDAKREAARKQKALDVAQAISGVAQAVIAALQVKPFFPLGLAMAAVATAMGAAQVAMIQQQPIPLASGAVFTEPTELFTGGRRYVAGEKGLEVMATEETLRRIVRDEVRGGGSGRAGGGAYGRPIALTVPIYIGTKKIKEEIISISQEGLDLGRLAIRGRNVRPS